MKGKNHINTGLRIDAALLEKAQLKWDNPPKFCASKA